jgi:O-antigen ligase
MLLRLILLVQIFYTVYQNHFPVETGITAINLPNALFLVSMVLIVMGPKEPAYVNQHHKAILTPSLLFFFAMLMLAFAIAQMRAPQDSLAYIIYLKTALFSPLLYFLYLRCGQDLKNTRLLIIAVMVVAAVAAVQAIRQGLDYGIGTFYESHRASGPFGSNYASANRAGVFYAMFLPMFIAMALFFRKQPVWRIAALTGIGLLGMAVMVTYSRQSYFIAVLGLALLLLRRNIVMAVLIGATLVSFASYLPDSVFERVQETRQKDTVGNVEVDESTASRWEIWAGAMAAWQANPAGVGLNRFKSEIGKYSAYVERDAHNFYVLTLTECGPQGLLGLLLVFRALFQAAKFMRKSAPPDNSEARALAYGFTITTLCLGVGNFYGSPFFEGTVIGDYWILAGLLERYFVLLNAGTEAAAETNVVVRPDPFARFPLAARTLPGPRKWPT